MIMEDCSDIELYADYKNSADEFSSAFCYI